MWSNVEEGISSLRTLAENFTPSGVLAVGFESTSVFTVAGQKGGFGVFIDFDNREAGTYARSGIQMTGNSNDFAGGVELQVAISVDYVKSIESFRGDSIDSGASLGPFGIDYSIVEGQGFVSGGFDIGLGGGGSAIKVNTETISHWEF